MQISNKKTVYIRKEYKSYISGQISIQIRFCKLYQINWFSCGIQISGHFGKIMKSNGCRDIELNVNHDKKV